MILIYIFVTIMAMTISAEDYNTPELDQYFLDAFIPLLSQLNVIDAIGITNTTATPTLNKMPTKEQMMYYNYYAAVNYYYDLKNLTCEYCQKIKPHIAHHMGLRSSVAGVAKVIDFGLLMHIRPNDTSNIMVHTGFYIATMSLYECVVQAIAYYRLSHPEYKIVITGLSLGAAMARLTFFFLKDRNQFKNAIYELYTFGEFRVGNKPFAEFMNAQNMTSARIVNRADIVCHLPPVTLLGTDLLYNFYIQPQTEFWINGADGQRFCSQSVFEDATCSNSIGPAYTLVDHFTYFDVNIATAFAQPQQLLSLPFNILPVELLVPALPKFIENPLGDLLDSAIEVILPWLG